MSGPIVRPARPSDAAAIADTHIRGWQVAYRGLVPDAVLDGFDVGRRTAAWRDHLAAEPGPGPTSWTWVVEAAAGEVVGFCQAGVARDEGVAPPDGAGEVYAIYLRPERRREGFGRALFAAVLTHLDAAGFDPLVVWVFEANEATRRFYEAAGFVEDGVRHEIDFDGVAIPEVRYARSGGRSGTSGT